MSTHGPYTIPLSSVCNRPKERGLFFVAQERRIALWSRAGHVIDKERTSAMKLRGQAAELVREFKHGYRLEVKGRNGMVGILDPDGKVVRMGTGQPLRLSANPPGGGHYWQNLRHALQDAGVIETERVEAIIRSREKKEKPTYQLDDDLFITRRVYAPPSVALVASWDEYDALEDAATFIAENAGLREQKHLAHFFELVERARAGMEKKLDDLKAVTL